MSPKKSKRIEMCVYCGTRPGKTDDHVPPRNLYSSALPSNVIKVPCCLQCNQGKRLNDDYFRESLVINPQTHDNLEAQAVLEGPLIRASLNPYHRRTPLLHSLRWSSLLVPRYNVQGDYLGDFVQVHLEPERIRSTLIGITQGLYFWFQRERLPDDYGIWVSHVESANARTEMEKLFRFGATRIYHLGDGSVFSCLFGFGSHEKTKSIWFMEFYQSIYYITFSAPLSAFPDRESSEKDLERLKYEQQQS